MRAKKRFAALTAAILTALSGAALAQEYDAQQAKSWMAQFAQALLQFSPINDPAQTLDPARPGEYLQEYEFGTVQAATSGTPTAAQIEEIDVSTAQVTDARGVRVGMTLSEALGGLTIPQAEGNLAVVSTQETGIGWCWAYLGEGGVYGVEWLTYDLYEPVTEYTLTYVIDGDTVSGIRVKTAASTRAQAEAGLFRCDADVYASGGALYMEGEAYGEPPFAEMSAESDSEATIRYLCRMENGEAARLDVGIRGGVVGYWHLYTGEEAADGE